MKPFTKISIVVFAIVSLYYLIRLATHSQINISGTEIPMWISLIGFLVAGLISFGLYKELKSS